MKFFIVLPKENVYTFFRRLGYRFEKQKRGQFVFSRIIGGASSYPRFHLYTRPKANDNEDLLELNLHLDQKRPIYKGARAHGGEYEGEKIQQEAKRIQQTSIQKNR